jgi:hypothetical protein
MVDCMASCRFQAIGSECVNDLVDRSWNACGCAMHVKCIHEIYSLLGNIS